MMRRRTVGARCAVANIVLLAVAAICLPADAGEPKGGEDLIRAHMEAGEFAPAVALARQAATVEQRDAWLAQIAAAQARAGAQHAALRSAADIRDDRARTGALSRIAAEPFGGRGGASQADFDALIDLITTTISPEKWEDVGGAGAISPFPTGVYVDAGGVLRPILKREATGELATLYAASAPKGQRTTARRSSTLRKVSLPRLEKYVQLRMAAGRRPTETMRALSGLQRIKYVFAYPESGDLVVAGPAGDWTADREHRIVSTQTGRPVLQLDDLVVVFRSMMRGPDARFGCAITPRQDALARTQAFLKESNKSSIRPGQRKAWLEDLRWQVGRQDIDIYGMDPRTRAARVLVEADYRMKLIGMGLEEGVPGVESYLDTVQVSPGQAPPAMDVLRWWFTLNYEAVLAAEDHQAFQIRGQGVQVLSENELLTAQGKRVHTGKSDELNRQFARSFTQHFEALCEKYPIYGELRNVFDLALVAALVRQQNLAEQAGWHMTCFGDPELYPAQLGSAPQTVETVINHRIVNRVHILAGVSGGVRVDPSGLVTREAIEIDRYGAVENQRSAAAPEELPNDTWWWD